MSELESAANQVLMAEVSQNESASPDTGKDAPKRRGRPPGSKNKNTNGNTSAVKSVNEKFKYDETEAGVVASAALFRTVWGLCTLVLPIRGLTEDEATDCGKALDPLVQKWLPIVADWQYEMNFVMTVYLTYEACKLTQEQKAAQSNAEVVS